jgi:hypothetical protein
LGVGGGAVGLAALVGGVIGGGRRGRRRTLDDESLRSLGFLPTVAVGLIEQAAKLIVPSAALLLLGVAAGAGFAVLDRRGGPGRRLRAAAESVAAELWVAEVAEAAAVCIGPGHLLVLAHVVPIEVPTCPRASAGCAADCCRCRRSPWWSSSLPSGGAELRNPWAAGILLGPGLARAPTGTVRVQPSRIGRPRPRGRRKSIAGAADI